ncbi:MAG: hypothetical protein V3V62_10080 [bacterium]
MKASLSHRAALGKRVRGAALALLLLSGGCSFSETKQIEVEIRVPKAPARATPSRAALVLVVTDAVTERNLSRSDDYILGEKTPLVSVLLDAAVARMRNAGIEPLQENEKAQATGRLVLSLTKLETSLDGRIWAAQAGLRAERYDKSGRRPMGRWESSGRGSHQDSRILSGAAGLAMGKAMGKALDNLPWAAIALGRR